MDPSLAYWLASRICIQVFSGFESQWEMSSVVEDKHNKPDTWSNKNYFNENRKSCVEKSDLFRKLQWWSVWALYLR